MRRTALARTALLHPVWRGTSANRDAKAGCSADSRPPERTSTAARTATVIHPTAARDRSATATTTTPDRRPQVGVDHRRRAGDCGHSRYHGRGWRSHDAPSFFAPNRFREFSRRLEPVAEQLI